MRRRGVELARRRGGGGAVYLEPARQLWLDAWIPRDDPLWAADVSVAAEWVGAWWVDALARQGQHGFDVHAGRAVPGEFGELVCFAGHGPGEVFHGGRKVVGLSPVARPRGARCSRRAHTCAGIPSRCSSCCTWTSACTGGAEPRCDAGRRGAGGARAGGGGAGWRARRSARIVCHARAPRSGAPRTRPSHLLVRSSHPSLEISPFLLSSGHWARCCPVLTSVRARTVPSRPRRGSGVIPAGRAGRREAVDGDRPAATAGAADTPARAFRRGLVEAGEGGGCVWVAGVCGGCVVEGNGVKWCEMV